MKRRAGAATSATSVTAAPMPQSTNAASVDPLRHRSHPTSPKKMGRMDVKIKRSRRDGFLLISIMLVQRELVHVGFGRGFRQRGLFFFSHHEILDDERVDVG